MKGVVRSWLGLVQQTVGFRKVRSVSAVRVEEDYVTTVPPCGFERRLVEFRMMKPIVAISGPPGSGKTTIAKRLSESLNLRYWSNGEYFRKLAAERGISFQEFHKYAESHPEIDKTLDERARKEAEKGSVVLDGRLSGWITRDMESLKVYLTAPLDVRVHRVMSRDGVARERALAFLHQREKSNRSRYLKLYKYDVENLETYDVILNTETWEIEDALEILKFALRRHFKDLPIPVEKHYASN